MKISDLSKCPFCGGAEFVVREFYSGYYDFRIRFDGKEVENSEMYDGLSCERYNKAYCGECGAYIGNPNTDTVGKRVEVVMKGKGK